MKPSGRKRLFPGRRPIPRLIAYAVDARIENLISWFAASVMTAAAVLCARSSTRTGQAGAGLRQSRPRPRSRWRCRRRAQPSAAAAARRPAPLHIPWRGWKDILFRTYLNIQDDRLLALAAGVVFYSLVALFPAIAAGVSSYALFADASTIGRHLSLLADIVPGSVLDLLGDEITRIAAKSDGRLTFGFVLGFVLALWSANAGMKAIFDALNIIYDEEESAASSGST